MNTIPLGTKLKLKKTGEIVTLIDIFHYPTTFKIQYDNGHFDNVRTHAVEFIDD
tara:strand:+ start:493 stop:654 length:162 start_codon:yes stop_codon:yes gene_type:complete